MTISNETASAIERVYEQESRRVLATLVGYFRDIDFAEDVLQEAFLQALKSWQEDGIPANPGAWLTVTARRKAIDRLRRNSNLEKKSEQWHIETELTQEDETMDEDRVYPDERLKLIFTCCHPALALDARVALTLRTLGGLTTTEIANAFLTNEIAMAQKLVRAKKKIKDAGIPYQVPPRHLITERLTGVLAVIYLIFNEGYYSHTDSGLIRHDLCAEAKNLARALNQLIAQEKQLDPFPEALGLLALILLSDSRRPARMNPAGELVLLEDQDRTLWNKADIQDGLQILDQALTFNRPGPYQIQAAISAIHAQAEKSEETDWTQVVALYDSLLRFNPSPVIQLNRAVALGMAEGPLAGLAILENLQSEKILAEYFPFHAAQADLFLRAGMNEQALSSYQKALMLSENPVEKDYVTRRIKIIKSS